MLDQIDFVVPNQWKDLVLISNNRWRAWTVVVTQLAEQSLLTPDDPGLNRVRANFVSEDQEKLSNISKAFFLNCQLYLLKFSLNVAAVDVKRTEDDDTFLPVASDDSGRVNQQ